MVLIGIDDRDVTNIITQTPATGCKENLKTWLMELKANNPAATIISLGLGRYQLTLPVITCTGAVVNTRFNIPHMHELIQMGFKHTDSADADSTDALAYSLSKRHHPNLWMLLLNIAETTASDVLDEYSDYFMEAGEYLIQSNTTNTDLLQVKIIIKMTGD